MKQWLIDNFGYEYKHLPELIRSIELAILTVVLTSLTSMDRITDYRTWLLALAVAIGHNLLVVLQTFVTDAVKNSSPGGGQ